MKRIFKLLVLAILIQGLTASAQDYTLPLYEGTIPNSKYTGAVEKIEKKDIILISNVQVPDIAVYLPSKRFATGQAVIICPGGGY